MDMFSCYKRLYALKHGDWLLRTLLKEIWGMPLPSLTCQKVKTSERQMVIATSRKLAVFSECVAAFCTAQELRWRFIGASCLHLPNISQVVPTLGAFNSDCGQCSKLLLFFAYNRHELLRFVLYNLCDLWLDFLARWSLSVAALWTSKYYRRLFASFSLFGRKARAAFRAKFHSFLLRCPFVFP